MDNSNLLFESIFKRSLSAVGTREYLEQVTNEHPYFSPAQFFLLLQSEPGSTKYQEQVDKTTVLFNNPYWLQFQLQEMQQSLNEPGDDNQTSESNHFIEPAIPVGESTQSTASQQKIAVAEADQLEAEDMLTQTDSVSLNTRGEFQSQLRDNDAVEEERESPDTEIPLLHAGKTQELKEENLYEPTIEENTIDISGPEKASLPLPHEPLLIPQEKAALSFTNQETDTNNDEKAHLVNGEKEHILNTPAHSAHFNNENSPLVNETEADSDFSTEEEIQPLNFKLNIDTTNVTESKLTFEPLHTTDYFASLGIKLSGDIKPTDRLGKQLKSFTEWLKTMKKLPTDPMNQAGGGPSDLTIQKLAEQSNKEDAVVTDAMADVLLQQGKTEKAIEVYKKLSLLNPSKSAYFAAKIDQLKEH